MIYPEVLEPLLSEKGKDLLNHEIEVKCLFPTLFSGALEDVIMMQENQQTRAQIF